MLVTSHPAKDLLLDLQSSDKHSYNAETVGEWGLILGVI